MALDDEAESAVQEIAAEVRRQVRALQPSDEGAVMRRLVALCRASLRDGYRQRVRHRAGMAARQAGLCGSCRQPFAEARPAPRSDGSQHLLCTPCTRKSRGAAGS